MSGAAFQATGSQRGEARAEHLLEMPVPFGPTPTVQADQEMPGRQSTLEIRHALEEAESWSRAVLVDGKRSDFVLVDPQAAMQQLQTHPLSVAWTALNRKVEDNLKCVLLET